MGFLLYSVQLLQSINYFEYNRAAWSAGNDLVNHGIPAKNVDAGYAFFGFNQHLRHGDATIQSQWGQFDWWSALFPKTEILGLVSFSQQINSKLNLVNIEKYKSYGFFGKSEVMYEYLVK